MSLVTHDIMWRQRTLCDVASFAPYDPTQEPIFPPKLLLRISSGKTTRLRANNGHVEWIECVAAQTVT